MAIDKDTHGRKNDCTSTVDRFLGIEGADDAEDGHYRSLTVETDITTLVFT